jgi:hypothetical protein
LTLKKKEKEQHMNFALSYTSGNKATLQTGVYKGTPLPYWDLVYCGFVNTTMEENIYYRQLMSNVNDYTMPDYFRIDIGYSFLKLKKQTTNELTVGLYNVLNRKNPYLIFHQDYSWKVLSIFPILPSVEWKISF